MRKTLILVACIILTGNLFAETVKLGPFKMTEIKKKEQKVKMKNVVIKEIKDNIIYLEDGKIKLENSVNDLTLSNPDFMVDFTGNSKKVREIKFPILADIEAIVMIGASEIPYGNVKKVLKIVIKVQGDKEVKKAVKELKEIEKK